MKMMMNNGTPHGDEAGFSLIELMVALVVTGIVTGAMFGLLTGGQNAFRREPELADRQQAIRISMDRIQRDIQAAGGSMGAFSQVFTDALNGAGDATIAPNPAVVPDVLEFLSHTGECPDIQISGTTGTQLDVASDIPACYGENALLIIEYDNDATKPGWAHMIQSGGGGFLTFPMGQQPPSSELDTNMTVDDLNCGDPVAISSQTPAVCMDPGANPVRVLQLDLVRYQIAVDPVDNMPSLWRSGLGGIDPNGAFLPPDDAAAATAGWRLIARGIDDMQIRYFTQAAGPNWLDNPGVPDFANQVYGTIVERVSVTLQARTTAANLAGATTSVAGGDAVRGQLTTVMVPRAALHNLTKEGAAASWH